MTFTSDIFLIGIFPFFVVLYTLFGKKNVPVRKILLLMVNCIFLIWGGTGGFLILCAYSVLIYLLSAAVYRIKSPGTLALSLILAAAPLIAIKYTVFIINTINTVLRTNTAVPKVIVPIGISFVTFEAISLLADLYKGKISRNPSPLNTFLYLTFFATVTSGPILRYDRFEEGLSCSTSTCEYTSSIERIIIGLSKKVLIADKLAYIADYYFDGTALGNRYSSIGLWVGAIAYTLQLYYDFSGYSDMAVGIGGLLGFDITENFNRPYQAASISDFWRRWHISLTQWFRDYVYIPLGGNRCSVYRHIFNMLVVWLLTGIWHGSDWSFVIWGLGYFVLLALEKYVPLKPVLNSKIISHVYTLFFVILLWVPFRAENLAVSSDYIRGMFGAGSGMIEEKAVRFLPFMSLAIILCFPWEKVFSRFHSGRWFALLKGLVIIALGALAVCGMANLSYAPYIYGNF